MSLTNTFPIANPCATVPTLCFPNMIPSSPLFPSFSPSHGTPLHASLPSTQAEGKGGEGKSGGGGVKVVTGTGNLRQGSITGYEGEIDQCVLDICSWFYAKAPVLALKEDVAGADAATIGSLEGKFGELPVGLRELLQIHDGGILLESFTMLSGKVRGVWVFLGGGEMGWRVEVGGELDG